MGDLNLGQDVANKEKQTDSGQAVRMRRYGSLIKIKPSALSTEWGDCK